MPKPPRYQQRGRQLSALIYRKFGPDRGAISKAAQEAGVNRGNWSQMLYGHINTPQKYFDALSALPDYEPPKPIDVWPAMGRNDLGEKTYKTYVQVPERIHQMMIDLDYHMDDYKGERPNFLTHEKMSEQLLRCAEYAHAKLLELGIIKKTETDYDPLS